MGRGEPHQTPLISADGRNAQVPRWERVWCTQQRQVWGVAAEERQLGHLGWGERHRASFTKSSWVEVRGLREFKVGFSCWADSGFSGHTGKLGDPLDVLKVALGNTGGGWD